MTKGEIQEKLKKSMKKEVSLMREVLANMQEEEQAIILNEMEILQQVMKKREPLLCFMMQLRDTRVKEMKNLACSIGLDRVSESLFEKKEDLDQLLDTSCSTNCEILSMRDQILSLLEKMNAQNLRNNYLLKKKVDFNKDLIDGLSGGNKNAMYDVHGSKGKSKTTTLTLLNREG